MADMIAIDGEGNAASEKDLRDGNYLLSMFVSPLGATLSIEVERKTDGRRWHGDFTARYIEDITQRAGNVKSFSNFVKMLRSATTNGTTNSTTASSYSKSLHVDVLTYQDLKMLKDGKNKNNTTDKKENYSFSNATAAPDKRYLILTYITEFDRVHYPLPLLHEEEEEVAEETAAMRRCIQRLRSELQSMKVRLQKYESPLVSFHQRRTKNSIASSNSEDEKNNYNFGVDRLLDYRAGTRPPDSTRTHTPRPLETRALQEKVKVLEDKLRTEAIAHKHIITALMRKNTLLQDEARKARAAERRMSEKLRDSEFQISLLRGRLKSLSASLNGSSIGASRNNLSSFPPRRPQRTSASPPIMNRCVSQGPVRPSSTPPTTTRSRYIDQGRLRRLFTASPTNRHVLHRPSSLPSRSRASSPMYSPYSITFPRLRTSGRSSSCPTSSRMHKGMETDNRRPHSASRSRKDIPIDDWLKAAGKPTKRFSTPSSMTSTTKTTTPQRRYERRSHEPIVSSKNRSRLEVDAGMDDAATPQRRYEGRSHEPIESSTNRRRLEVEAGIDGAASEVEEIDSRLFALQDYLKKANSHGEK